MVLTEISVCAEDAGLDNCESVILDVVSVNDVPVLSLIGTPNWSVLEDEVTVAGEIGFSVSQDVDLDLGMPVMVSVCANASADVVLVGSPNLQMMENNGSVHVVEREGSCLIFEAPVTVVDAVAEYVAARPPSRVPWSGADHRVC